MRLFVRTVHLVSTISGVVAALLIFGSLVVVCHMVFTRAVLGISSIWQTEFVIFSLIASTFLGAPYVLKTRGHVNVDLLPLMSAQPMRLKLAWVANLLSLAFCLLFLYASLHWWWDAWRTNETTASIWKARLWIPYASVPVGLALLSLQYLADLWQLWTGEAQPFGLHPGDGL